MRYQIGLSYALILKNSQKNSLAKTLEKKKIVGQDKKLQSCMLTDTSVSDIRRIEPFDKN